MKIKILEEFETLKYEKFDLVFTESDFDIVIKELKINYASCNDFITNEMLTKSDNKRLFGLLLNIYDDMVCSGLSIPNFNVSIINPFLKKVIIAKKAENYKRIKIQQPHVYLIS